MYHEETMRGTMGRGHDMRGFSLVALADIMLPIRLGC
jgi:hypothetical protein